MFLGHGLAAFAIAASVAARRGWRGERALAVGLVAGLFATLPDVDMLYAVAGLLGGMEGVFVTSDFSNGSRGEGRTNCERGSTGSKPTGDVMKIRRSCLSEKSVTVMDPMTDYHDVGLPARNRSRAPE